MHYRFCPLCGAKFDSEGGESCNSCCKFIPPLSDTPKNPVIAVILTAFLPGFGQVYNGDSFKKAGLVFIFFTVGIFFLIIPGIIIWILAIYDAYIKAKKINCGESTYRETDNGKIALFLILVIVVGICMIAFTLYLLEIAMSQGIEDTMSTEMKRILVMFGY